jgi:hypothetical protein
MPDNRGALPTGLRHENRDETDMIMTQIRCTWISTAAGLAPAGAAAIR